PLTPRAGPRGPSRRVSRAVVHTVEDTLIPDRAASTSCYRDVRPPRFPREVHLCAHPAALAAGRARRRAPEGRGQREPRRLRRVTGEAEGRPLAPGVGMVGAGQLARVTCQAAISLGTRFPVLPA